MRLIKVVSAAMMFVALTGCASTVIETAADAAIAVAKVPFKVGGAVVDVVTDDDNDRKQDEDKDDNGE